MADMKQDGLDDQAIEQEHATVLPERDAMSLIDPGVTKIALAEFLGTPDPSLPTTGQGINEKPPTT